MARTQTAQTEATDERDSNLDNEKKPKSRRPANTAFRQQRLKAWQPILTPKTVLPLFFAIAVIFAPIGGLLLYASAQVEELVIDYTNCLNSDATVGAPLVPDKTDTTLFRPIPTGNYQINFKTSAENGDAPTWVQSVEDVSYWRGAVSSASQPGAVTLPKRPVCSIQFPVLDDIGPPVLMYYRLTNFYQNHRRYVKSLDSDQLLGTAVDIKTINGSACDPLQSNGTRPYYPCGLIANSIFNDTISSPMALNPAGDSGSSPVPYVMTDIGIAWPSDATLYGNTSYSPDAIAVPPNWQDRWGGPNYTAENGPPDLNTYEAFQVWMRTAGLPSFSKLYLRNNNLALSKGRYQIDIIMNFPADSYSGTKSIVISTTTVMGGKNPFLGVAYVVVGALAVLLGFAFTAAQLIKPRKLGDHTYLSWNNDQPSTATASGVSRPGHDSA